MKVFVLSEDPREGSEVLLVTKDESVAIRKAIEILRENFMPDDPKDEGHIWFDYAEFDAELQELGETAFWHKNNTAWHYCVCSIWPMELDV